MSLQVSTLIYSLLICFGGGLLAFLGFAELQGVAPKTRIPAAIAAGVLLLAGGVVLALGLPNPAAVMSIAKNAVKGTPKSLEFVAAIVCFVIAIVNIVVTTRAESETPVKVMGGLCLILGVLIGVFSGNAAAVGRAGTSLALPVAYLGNGLFMGGALFTGLMAVLDDDAKALKRVGIAALCALVVQLVGFVWYGAVAGFTTSPVLFWVGSIVVGVLCAAACLWFSPKVRALLFAAAACSVVGGDRKSVV